MNQMLDFMVDLLRTLDRTACQGCPGGEKCTR